MISGPGKGAIVLATLLLVGACTSNAPTLAPGASVGGEAQVTLPEDVDTMDPTFAGTAAARIVYLHTCEKLYDISAEGGVIPQLAAAMPELSADGLTMTIKVRTDATFNDGTALDAAAVKKSLDRHMTAEGSKRKSELSSISEISTPDSSTVALKLKNPDVSLIGALADRAGTILAPTAVDKLGDKFGSAPVCVGAFKFVEQVTGDRVVVAKSEYYYAKDKVKLDKITFRWIPDENVRVANLRSGELQVVNRLPGTEVANFQGDKNFNVQKVVTWAFQSITFNVANANGMDKDPAAVAGPTGNLKFRQAFDLALDREAINKIINNGLMAPACQPLTSATPYAPDIACPPRDLARAKQLLAESGLPVPVKVTFLIVTGTTNQRLAELMQAQVKEAGIDMAIQAVEVATEIQEGKAGQFEIALTSWSGRVDPDANIYRMAHCSGFDNWSKACDPELDTLLADARKEADTGKRTNLYSEAIARMRDLAPVLTLWHTVAYTASTDKLTGYEMRPDGLPRLTFAAYAN